MSRGVLTETVALVLVRSAGRVLLVQELDGSWYLPGGGVDPGETLVEGALREAEEEAGVRVRLTGLHRIEHRPLSPDRSRLRVLFGAEVLAGEPRQSPNRHTLGARWWPEDAIPGLRLRGDELPRVLAETRGRPLLPLNLITACLADDPWVHHER